MYFSSVYKQICKNIGLIYRCNFSKSIFVVEEIDKALPVVINFSDQSDA